MNIAMERFHDGQLRYKIGFCLTICVLAVTLFVITEKLFLVVYSLQNPDSIKILDNGTSLYAELPIGHMNLEYASFPREITEKPHLSDNFFPLILIIILFCYDVPNFLIAIILSRILYCLCRKTTPFFKKMSKYTYIISFTLIIKSTIMEMLYQCAFSYLIFNKIYFDNPIQFKILFVGILVLLFSNILKQGYLSYELQSNSTTTG